MLKLIIWGEILGKILGKTIVFVCTAHAELSSLHLSRLASLHNLYVAVYSSPVSSDLGSLFVL